MSVRRHVIEPVQGLTPGLGFYLGGMNEVREQLRETVADLPAESLARRALPGAHTIGALLLHIGESEWFWINCIIEGREITDADRQAVYWDALEKEDAGQESVTPGTTARQCLDVIDELRERTHRLLASLDDGDMERVFSWQRRDGLREVTLRWILHHLIDHEAQHKGQILLLKRLLVNSKC